MIDPVACLARLRAAGLGLAATFPYAADLGHALGALRPDLVTLLAAELDEVLRGLGSGLEEPETEDGTDQGA